MKKIIATALAATMALSGVSVFAQENEAVLISEETQETATIQEFVSDKISYNGVVKEVGEDYIVVSAETEFRFNLGEETYICDYDLAPVETLKAEDEITVVASAATTRSIPPQAAAYYILVRTDENAPAPIYAQVASNNGSEIMSADGRNRIVFDESTPVAANKIRIALRGQDITVGSEIIAFASVVGMSLPAHVPAEKIAVLNLVPVAEETTEETAEETAKETTEETEEITTPDHDVEKITFDGITYEIPFDYTSSPLFGENASERLPLRAVCEGMGYTVTWKGEDESIVISKDEKSVTLFLGKPMSEEIDEIPVEIDGTTYVTTKIFSLLAGKTADVAQDDNGVIVVR